MTLKYLGLLGILLVTFVLLFGCSNGNVEIDTGDKLVTVKVEISDDDAERARGLMFRESLGENEGMFFIFEDSKERTFWMKSTLIPLDIIFISDDNKVLNVLEAEPCRDDTCKTYSSDGNAKYVLEVNKGFSKKSNIKEGDAVRLR